MFCRVMVQGQDIAVWRVRKRKNKSLCVMKREVKGSALDCDGVGWSVRLEKCGMREKSEPRLIEIVLWRGKVCP